MEELLIEMKSDVVRLPAELAKMPSVSTQLKMDEISIISKLAKTPVTSQSVITQAPPSSGAVKIAARSKSPRPIKKDVVQGSQVTSKYKVAYASSASTQLKPPPGPQVQLPTGGRSLTVQTPEGLVVYSVASSATPTQPAISVVQAVGGGGASTGPTAAVTSTAGQQQTIASGVPASYIEGYQAVQLVPAAASAQQVVYWPQGTAAVVGAAAAGGSGQAVATPAQVTTVPAAATGAAGVGQLAVVQQKQPATVLQSVQLLDSTGKPTGQASVITID